MNKYFPIFFLYVQMIRQLWLNNSIDWIYHLFYFMIKHLPLSKERGGGGGWRLNIFCANFQTRLSKIAHIWPESKYVLCTRHLYTLDSMNRLEMYRLFHSFTIIKQNLSSESTVQLSARCLNLIGKFWVTYILEKWGLCEYVAEPERYSNVHPTEIFRDRMETAQKDKPKQMQAYRCNNWFDIACVICSSKGGDHKKGRGRWGWTHGVPNWLEWFPSSSQYIHSTDVIFC